MPPESTAAAAPEEPASAAQRALSVAGNALVLAALGSGAFFGYYTYAYSTDQVRVMVDETKKNENGFPSQVMPHIFLSKASALHQLHPHSAEHHELSESKLANRCNDMHTSLGKAMPDGLRQAMRIPSTSHAI